MSVLPANYQQIIVNLKEKIRQARLKAAFVVNKELLQIYWEIGNTILLQQKEAGWGSKIIDRLSADLKLEFEDFKGLSVRNLKYMRAFAEAWPEFGFVQQPAAQTKETVQQSIIIVQQLVAQLPWGHHQVILDKLKTKENRLFYIQKSVDNGWSRNILVKQIETKLHERTGGAITNFKQTLPAVTSDLAQQILKNPYVFDFLSFDETLQERELEKALIQHLKKFMLELGRGFAYVGNQYNLKVEDDEFFLDLLFFNYKLNCFVIFELKIGEFEPEFAGKLNFYINTIDEQIKSSEHKPTIGVLLCKTPNSTVVKYSLQGITTPMGVSEYHLTQKLPLELKDEIPGIEELQAEIQKEAEILQKPVDTKLGKLRKIVDSLGKEEVKIKLTKEVGLKLAKNVLAPFTAILDKQLVEVKNFFNSWQCNMYTDHGGRVITHGMEKHVVKIIHQRDKEFSEWKLSFRFEGFKKAGIHAFDEHLDAEVKLQPFKYSFMHENKILLEKQYDQFCTNEELQTMAEQYTEGLIEGITYQAERIKKETTD